jgi:hypothetical protein
LLGESRPSEDAEFLLAVLVPIYLPLLLYVVYPVEDVKGVG